VLVWSHLFNLALKIHKLLLLSSPSRHLFPCAYALHLSFSFKYQVKCHGTVTHICE